MEKPMKILLTIPFFYPHKGGAQKYAEELYAHVKKLHPDVHINVLTYNTDNVLAFEIYRGLNVYRLPCYQIIKGKFVLPKLLPLLKTLRKLNRQKYDYVNSHTAFFDTTWWAWFFARKNGAKSIFTGHAPGHPTHQIKAVEIVGKLVHIILGKWAVGHYDICTYANRKSKEFFEKHMGAKIGGKIISVSIDSALFNTTRPQKTFTNDITISYVGRIIETKGLLYFFDAILSLQQQVELDTWKRLKFVFAGEGPLVKQLTILASKHGLSEKFFFPGNLEYAQVADLLKQTDIFVSPSSHAEGLPTTIMEAGACGCVIVATNSGSISDVIVNKSTGLLVSMKDSDGITKALVWALDNRNEADTLAKNMSQLVLSRYTWEKTAQEFYDFLLTQLPQ